MGVTSTHLKFVAISELNKKIVLFMRLRQYFFVFNLLGVIGRNKVFNNIYNFYVSKKVFVVDFFWTGNINTEYNAICNQTNTVSPLTLRDR